MLLNQEDSDGMLHQGPRVNQKDKVDGGEGVVATVTGYWPVTVSDSILFFNLKVKTPVAPPPNEPLSSKIDAGMTHIPRKPSKEPSRYFLLSKT